MAQLNSYPSLLYVHVMWLSGYEPYVIVVLLKISFVLYR